MDCHKGCFVLPCILVLGLLVVIPSYLAAFYANLDGLQILGSKAKYQGVVPGNGVDELIVLLHVSDIHVSRFQGKYADQFREFCENVVPAIDPRGVFATGDLTDGYGDERRRGGEQQLVEWQEYRAILNSSGLLSKPNFFYYDVRGNHDAYGSADINDLSTNLYETFGATSGTMLGQPQDKRTWGFDLAAPSGSTYRFVGLDATINPGIAKPFQYFATMLSDTKENALKRVRENSTNIGFTVLMGHHPASQTAGGLGELQDEVPYYLCGHIHDENMKQRLGTMIELEVADLKTHQAYRLMAIDHGQLSFSEQSVDPEEAFPIGLITNPKDAKYLSEYEPNHVSLSTHIRILAYTSVGASISSVEVDFDDKGHPAAGSAAPVSDGLFALAWNPQTHFQDGKLHRIIATITDSNGRVKVVTHSFSLDGTTDIFGTSYFQLEQAIGQMALVHQLVFVAMALTNVVFMLLHRKEMIPLLTTSVKESKLALALSLFNVFFITELIVGPILVGFFSSTANALVLAFPYGVYMFGVGFGIDAQTSVYAYLVQICLVLPYQIFFMLYFKAYEIEHLTSFNYKQLVKFDGSVVRILIPIYFAGLIVGAPAFLFTTYFDHILPLFISPAMWFLFGAAFIMVSLQGKRGESEASSKTTHLMSV